MLSLSSRGQGFMRMLRIETSNPKTKWGLLYVQWACLLCSPFVMALLIFCCEHPAFWLTSHHIQGCKELGVGFIKNWNGNRAYSLNSEPPNKSFKAPYHIGKAKLISSREGHPCSSGGLGGVHNSEAKEKPTASLLSPKHLTHSHLCSC